MRNLRLRQFHIRIAVIPGNYCFDYFNIYMLMSSTVKEDVSRL